MTQPSECNLKDNQRKHFEFPTIMKERFPELYYGCGCCKCCVEMDGHRRTCPLRVESP